jgi:hypothetical protein
MNWTICPPRCEYCRIELSGKSGEFKRGDKLYCSRDHADRDKREQARLERAFRKAADTQEGMFDQ